MVLFNIARATLNEEIMPVTQKDIANRLHLSRSLVGAVLSDKAGEWVSLETKQRILQTASEMQYRPHAAAKALRSGKTQVVAFHFFPPEPWSRQHTGSMIETLAEELALWNYKLIVSVASQHNDEAFETIMTSRCCDAVVMYGSECQVEEPAQRLEIAGIPFVVVAGFSELHSDWHQVDFDHKGMMEQSVAYLVSHGHSRIGYLGHDNDQHYAQQLMIGIEGAAQSRSTQLARVLIDRTSTANPTANVIERWLSLPLDEQPTAVIIGTPDATAWREVEIGLARHGRLLGTSEGQFAAVGLSDGEISLFFGQGVAFRLHDRTQMTQEMVRLLLGPLLRDERVDNPVLRVMPALEPLCSSNLLQVSHFLNA